MTQHYWDTKKGSINPDAYVSLTCNNCGKAFVRARWYHERLQVLNKGRGDFCTRHCALVARPVTGDTASKISLAQRGISVLSRGRPGKIVSEAIREKIRQTKLGVSYNRDHDIILREATYRNLTRFANLDIAPVPDMIYIDSNDGRLTALEVEKKHYETDIRRKMKTYDNNTSYDKVIIVWYTPDGIRRKEWQRIGAGEWRTL